MKMMIRHMHSACAYILLSHELTSDKANPPTRTQSLRASWLAGDEETERIATFPTLD